MSRPTNVPARANPGPGQESVWDFPRPPRLELERRRLRVVLGGVTIADTVSGLRVLETSHSPNYYIPLVDIREDVWKPMQGRVGVSGRAGRTTSRFGAVDAFSSERRGATRTRSPAYAELAGTRASIRH